MQLVEFLLREIADDEAAARLRGEQTFGPDRRRIANEALRDPHDPARVLAVCAALRAIVEYEPPRARSAFDDAYRRGQLNMHADLLRLLAQPFADRPGFDPAWKVET